MHYLERKFVCERLAIGRMPSYRMFGGTRIHLIPSDSVISALNSSRRGGEPTVDFIPSDIVSPSAMAGEIGVSESRLLGWTRRKRNPAPHYRFNKQTTRFRRSTLGNWMRRMCNA